jgi:hypothetical protein
VPMTRRSFAETLGELAVEGDDTRISVTADGATFDLEPAKAARLAGALRRACQHAREEGKRRKAGG